MMRVGIRRSSLCQTLVRPVRPKGLYLSGTDHHRQVPGKAVALRSATLLALQDLCYLISGLAQCVRY